MTSCFYFKKSLYNKNATKPRINIFKLQKQNRDLEKLLAVKRQQRVVDKQTKKINACLFAWVGLGVGELKEGELHLPLLPFPLRPCIPPKPSPLWSP